MRAEAQLTALDDQPLANDPSLLDELPYLPGILAQAPDALKEKPLASMDVQCLYRKGPHQATIWATITDTTLAALLAGPRTDTDQPAPQTPVPAQAGELAQSPINHLIYRDHERGTGTGGGPSWWRRLVAPVVCFQGLTRPDDSADQGPDVRLA